MAERVPGAQALAGRMRGAVKRRWPDRAAGGAAPAAGFNL
jgi:hypothetical protein